MSEFLRSNGRKVTAQRQSIVRALHGNVGHPSAEAVYDLVRIEVPTISLKTVYQTLYELVEMGEVLALDVGTGSVRFDPNVEPHHHLVCQTCGKVRDLHMAFPELSVPPAKTQGYQVGTAEVIFRGRCEECRGPASPARSPSPTGWVPSGPEPATACG